MRIISGKRRGYKLVAPEGMDTRPTTDRVKESVFNIIQTGLPCGAVLDMFAGSGALGLEALSRGAETAVFIETNPASLRALRRNLEGSGLNGGMIIGRDAFLAAEGLAQSVSAENSGRFDLIFLDPPYNKGLVRRALETILRLDLLSADGLIIAETEVGGESPEGCGFRVKRAARYGKTVITVMQR